METLRDYLRWHVVRAFAAALAPAFEDEAFDFYARTLAGQKEMRPRWKRVLDSASQDIGELVARLYVEAAFSAQAKQRCEEMVGHLLSAMGQALRDADWMTETTRAEALRKLDGFEYKIGFPDEWRTMPASSSSGARTSPTGCAVRRSSTTGRWPGSASLWTGANGRCPPTS